MAKKIKKRELNKMYKRHGELVDKEFRAKLEKRGLSDEEQKEPSDLEAALDDTEAPYYEKTEKILRVILSKILREGERDPEKILNAVLDELKLEMAKSRVPTKEIGARRK